MNRLSLLWWHLRRKTKLLRAWINRDAIAYLDLHCSDFIIDKADWPRCYGVGPEDAKTGFSRYYGSGAHYTVVACMFWYAGRGRGYTAWQAAVRAVRHMDRRGKAQRKAQGVQA